MKWTPNSECLNSLYKNLDEQMDKHLPLAKVGPMIQREKMFFGNLSHFSLEISNVMFGHGHDVQYSFKIKCLVI